ncbi:cupin domain-containing protein [Nocardia mangyaensis]|uniref:cupin domain-containing protein n=1 Tax=Nocardia mangyaensis TaxID=2213200 RepID=UPI0014300414|nr:cupin domain-containing protein [Nocardia mangyaensis]
MIEKSPESGFHATELAFGYSAEGLAIAAFGEMEVLVRDVTIMPGEGTGWHYHPGPVIVIVLEGEVTQCRPDGGSRKYRAGEALVEPGDPEWIHDGRNLGDRPVRMIATYLLPAGAPPAVQVLPPSRPAPRDVS